MAKPKPPKGIRAGLWSQFVETFGDQGDEDRATRTAAAEQLLGRRLPPDLRVIGWVDPPRGTIFPPPVAELLASANAFEALLDSAGLGNHEPLAHFLVGCHHLREDETSGDAYCFALPPVAQANAACVVVLWDHDEGCFSYTVAPSLVHFELGEPTKQTWPEWPTRQSRSRWIAQALSGKRPTQDHWPTAEGAAEFDEAIASPEFTREVPDALYWLWRTVLLGEDALARRTIDRLLDSPARLLRDAAVIAREVLEGRRALGPIDDLPALRRRLAEIITDPEAAAEHEAELLAAEAADRLTAALPPGIAVHELSEPPERLVWQGTDDNLQAEWTLPSGAILAVSNGDVTIAQPKRKPKPIPGEHADESIDAVNVRSDFEALLVRSQTSLFEIPLPSGPGRLVEVGGDGSGAVAWIDRNRVVTTTCWDTWTQKLHERRGEIFVPGSACDVPGGDSFGVVAGGRITLTGGDETIVVGVYDDRLRELARFPLAWDRLATLGERVIVRDYAGRHFELTGLAALHEARRPSPWQPPYFVRATRVDAPRPAGLEPALVERLAGKLIRAKHPRDAALMHVVLSPSGRRAAIWKSLDSFVRVVDCKTGKTLAQWEDDPASGHVADATWLDDDYVAWAHWQAHVHRVGEDDAIVDLDHGFTSIAACRGADGRWLIAGITPADADGPQALRGIVVEDLASEPTWFERPLEPIVDRLATVVRHGDQALVEIGELWWTIDSPDARDLAPPPEVDEDE